MATRINQAALVLAVRKACQSQIDDHMFLGGPDPLLYASSDYEAATICGADTLSVSAWAGYRGNTIHSRLHRLWRSGELIRVGNGRKKYRWWPMNFFQEVSK